MGVRPPFSPPRRWAPNPATHAHYQQQRSRLLGAELWTLGETLKNTGKL